MTNITQLDPETSAEDYTDQFYISRSGTYEARVHILDNDIRSGLAEESIIDWDQTHSDRHDTDEKRKMFDKKCIYSIPTLLKDAPIYRLMMVAQQNEKDHMRPFWSMLMDEIDKLSTLATNHFNDTGKLTYGFATLVLKKGTVVGVFIDGQPAALQIDKCYHTDTWRTGPCISIAGNIVIKTHTGFQYGQINSTIPAYVGDLSLDELGMFTITDAMKARLIARGRQYVKATAKSVQLMYKGNVSRVEYFGKRATRANGRVMVDHMSMRLMDPDYNQYLGFSDVDVTEGEVADKSSNSSVDIELDSILMLCSPFVYGFSFAATQWGEFVVENLTEVQYRDDAYDKLCLNADIKDTMRVLVEHHHTTQDSNDLIDGKGGGCTFLLDGSPGIGKTASAECLAELLHRPLYSVSSGELGTTPEDLELRLKKILDMASNWNAVLLIDEVDIFLEKRDKTDIHRNTLVGIFLKLLEYYDGILFLTTNRVECIDAAFVSRISLSVHFPDLDAHARRVVWNNLLNLVTNKSDQIDTDALSQIVLNGRDIKHIVRLANIVAQSSKEPLNMNHIERFLKLRADFGSHQRDTNYVYKERLQQLLQG